MDMVTIVKSLFLKVIGI